jgi:drug/metabolite transporter (DMT)-like permease
VAYLFVFLAAFFWGGSFVATRYALTDGGLGVFTVLAARFLLSSLILLVLVAVRGRERLGRRRMGVLLGAAVVYPGLYFFLETTGISRTSAVLTSIIISIIPVLTGVASRLFLKERLALRGWTGALLSVGGIAAIVILGRSGVSAASGTAGEVSWLGVLVLSGAVIMGTIYITSTRYLMGMVRPLTLTTVQNVMGFLFFVPLAGAEMARGLPTLSLGALAAIGFLGIGASVGAILSFNKALSLIEAGRASMFLNVIPVISLLFGWLLLGERLAPLQLVAAAVVVGGVTLGSWRTGGPRSKLNGVDGAAAPLPAGRSGVADGE